jgi:hypothetical protein
VFEVWGFGVYNLEELHLDTSNKLKVSSLIFLVMFYLKHSPFECNAWLSFSKSVYIKSSLFVKQQKPTPLQYSSYPSFYPSSRKFVYAFIFSGLVPSWKTEHSKK